MHGAKKTILIVDDASLVRLYYRTILEQAGFRLDEALNGLEAIEKILASAPDAVIVDVNMPQMDGFTFLGHLRAKPAPLCSIPALVTSTEGKEPDFEAARNAGANYYMVKPAEGPALVEVVSLLCGLPR